MPAPTGQVNKHQDRHDEARGRLSVADLTPPTAGGTALPDQCRDGAIVAIQVKAASAVDQHDARHLAWFRDELPAGHVRAGLVLYTGTLVRPLGDHLWAVPIRTLWA